MSLRCIPSLMALSLLLASGCASSYQAYPSSWDALRPPGEERCGELAGTYLNLGTIYPPPMNPAEGPRLAHLLVKKSLLQNDAVHVVLTYPAPGEFRLTGFHEGQIVYEKTLYSATGDFVCRPEGIAVADTSTEFVLGVAMTRTEFLLGKTARGDLAVRQRDVTGGLCCLVLPWGMTETRWYLFQSVGTGL